MHDVPQNVLWRYTCAHLSPCYASEHLASIFERVDRVDFAEEGPSWKDDRLQVTSYLRRRNFS